jgi:DNA-binding protein
MAKKLLSLAAMENILKKAGASRVSEDAKKALKEVVEEYGAQIAENSVKFAKHSGRKTVKDTDVKLASR